VSSDAKKILFGVVGPLLVAATVGVFKMAFTLVRLEARIQAVEDRQAGFAERQKTFSDRERYFHGEPRK
jgi:hypothetical protein